MTGGAFGELEGARENALRSNRDPIMLSRLLGNQVVGRVVAASMRVSVTMLECEAATGTHETPSFTAMMAYGAARGSVNKRAYSCTGTACRAARVM